MKVYLPTLIVTLGIPATSSFAPQTFPVRVVGPSACDVSATTTLVQPLQMSDDDFDDDWHSDYDPSKYEQSNNGYENESRGRGGSQQRRGGRGGRGGGRGGRGRGRGGRGSSNKPKDYLGPNGHDYIQSSDSNGHNSSRFAEADIHALLAERLQAKFARDFRTADMIQMELIDGGVFVHDGTKEWRADGVPYGSFRGGPDGGGRARKMDNQQYAKSAHSSDVEGASDDLINKLVQERTKFKMMRQYTKADAVREGLRTKFNVLVDDRLKQWSVGGDFGEEHNAQRELADKFANRGYIKSASSLDLDEEEEEYIQHHVDARVTAKKDRNFDTADKIRLDLAQRFDVTINDKQKLWSIGGVFEELGGKVGKPKGVYTRRGGGDLTSEDEDLIAKMLMDRYHAKKQRNFDVADQIRDELYSKYNVKVDDRSSEWHVDTDEYAMSGGENNLAEEEVQFIDTKLKERFNFKRLGQYDEADEIRDGLKERFNVKIDDRTKEWSVETVFVGEAVTEPEEEESLVW